MKKKMTTKEFKEAFNAVGFDFDIWGWEGILNLIAIAETHNSIESVKLGSQVCAQQSNDRRNQIVALLTERGFYDN